MIIYGASFSTATRIHKGGHFDGAMYNLHTTTKTHRATYLMDTHPHTHCTHTPHSPHCRDVLSSEVHWDSCHTVG